MTCGEPQIVHSFFHSPRLILERFGVLRPSQVHKSENVGERNIMGSLRQNLLGRAGDVLYAIKAGRHLNLRKDRKK